MKRFLILLLIGGLSIPAVRAQQHRPLPSGAELKAVNDSIFAEAQRLYLYEKASWIMEDLVYGGHPDDLDKLGGWIPVSEQGASIKGLFFDKEQKKVLYEASVDLKTGQAFAASSSRDLTAEEMDAVNVHRTVVNAVFSLDEKLTYPSECTFNIQAIPIGDNLYRVYWMLGTSRHGIVPFGCDFSYDCDRDGNIKEFRRYHKTYIPAELTMDDGSQVVSIVHSHTEVCAYIAPTDIALFHLYGYEKTRVKSLMIVSTIFHCYFSYDAETREITVGQLGNNQVEGSAHSVL